MEILLFQTCFCLYWFSTAPMSLWSTNCVIIAVWLPFVLELAWCALSMGISLIFSSNFSSLNYQIYFSLFSHFTLLSVFWGNPLKHRLFHLYFSSSSEIISFIFWYFYSVSLYLLLLNFSPKFFLNFSLLNQTICFEILHLILGFKRFTIVMFYHYWSFQNCFLISFLLLVKNLINLFLWIVSIFFIYSDGNVDDSFVGKLGWEEFGRITFSELRLSKN